jgi:hypothetical protein
VRAAFADVVAAQRGQRDRDDALEVEMARELAVVAFDAVEDLARPADEIELVHREHDVADAEQGDDVAVPPRLREQAFARVDEDHGEVGGRGAGHHVARVLLVARRVGDDELALRSREEAVGDVDGDALLALGGQAVDEQREIEVVALRAETARIVGERGELVVGQRVRCVQQAADQRALAVVDAAAGDEAQQVLDARRRFVRFARHQK